MVKVSGTTVKNDGNFSDVNVLVDGGACGTLRVSNDLVEGVLSRLSGEGILGPKQANMKGKVVTNDGSYSTINVYVDNGVQGSIRVANDNVEAVLARLSGQSEAGATAAPVSAEETTTEVSDPNGEPTTEPETPATDPAAAPDAAPAAPEGQPGGEPSATPADPAAVPDAPDSGEAASSGGTDSQPAAAGAPA